jgi:DNA-binding CsgD family transcriptional regulator
VKSSSKRKRGSARSRRSTEASTRTREAASEARSRKAALTPPEGLSATALLADPDEFVVLSYPIAHVHLPAGLTDAEREVVLSVLEGKSNGTIADERGRSIRTVANQIGSVFRKLGVTSRAELVARCARRPKGEP